MGTHIILGANALVGIDGTARDAGGFQIFRDATGKWRLDDTDDFNCWGLMADTFDTVEAATDFAWRCYDFKCGRLSTLERRSWEQ